MAWVKQAAAGEADPAAVLRLCQEGEEAADFIRTYVVQARLNERGNYGVLPRRCCKMTILLTLLTSGLAGMLSFNTLCTWVSLDRVPMLIVLTSVLCSTAMQLEEHHSDTVAEEAALRPPRPPQH